jgi:dipeptidyl-peptidase 4
MRSMFAYMPVKLIRGICPVLLKMVLFSVVQLGLAAPGWAEQSALTPLERYQRAAQFLPDQGQRLVDNVEPPLAWSPSGQTLALLWARDGGMALRVINASTGSWRDLPLPGARREKQPPPLRFDGESTVQIGLGAEALTCRLLEQSCGVSTGRSRAFPPDAAVAPGGDKAIVARDGNLFLLTLGKATRQLTRDGTPMLAYGASGWDERPLTEPSSSQVSYTPSIAWSPNGSSLLVARADVRGVAGLPILDVMPGGEWGGIPEVRHNTPYPTPQASVVPRFDLHVIDLRSGQSSRLARSATGSDPISAGLAWWAPNGQAVFFIRESRAFDRISLFRSDLVSGKSSLLIDEKVASQHPLAPDRYPAVSRAAPDGRSVLWYSDQDGYGHLYRYDATSGRLMGRLTSGDWLVRRIMHVDATNGDVYFVGLGREQGKDPYFSRLYRASPDGRKVDLLTPEDATHRISFSPAGNAFLDSFSTVERPPVHRLRRTDGTLIADVGEATIEPLRKVGWTQPKRFTAKAADGVTDLYGTMFFPGDFDPQRRYAVIDHYYPGPQIINAPYGFLDGQEYGDWIYWVTQSFAELGAVAVIVDGRGTPMRSRAFHRVSYAPGFGIEQNVADHVAVIRELAQRHSFIDVARVGVFGHSSGGFAAFRAMVEAPELYSVGVASAGSHDERLGAWVFAERYVGGLSDPQRLASLSSAPLASRLRGKLLLMHGMLDRDVHVGVTFQLAEALIQANKDFDLIIMPRGTHTAEDHPYFIRRRWDFFARHLLGYEPPADVRVDALSNAP